LREEDVLARVGGDEFSVLLPETGEESLLVVLERVGKSRERFNESNPEFPVRFSVGSATALQGADMPDALKLADERMYADKILHKGTRANSGA
jgi:diguanylate cyclase (GGDEF)-like protein